MCYDIIEEKGTEQELFSFLLSGEACCYSGKDDMDKLFLQRFDEMMKSMNTSLPAKVEYRIVRNGETCDELADRICLVNQKHYCRNQREMIGNWCFFKTWASANLTCNLSLDDIQNVYDLNTFRGWERLYGFLHEKLLCLVKSSSLKMSGIDISNLDTIKNLLYIGLKPFEERMEEENVCRRYGDIACLLYVNLGEIEETIFSYRVERRHMKLWKTQESRLFDIAIRNMMKKYPAQMFTNLQDIDDHNYCQSVEEVRNLDYFTMTSHDWGANGAATIFYPGMMEEIYEKFGPFFAVFTSDREVNIHSAARFDYDVIRRILRDTDRAFPQGKLSDTIFLYVPQKGLVPFQAA